VTDAATKCSAKINRSNKDLFFHHSYIHFKEIVILKNNKHLIT